MYVALIIADITIYSDLHTVSDVVDVIIPKTCPRKKQICICLVICSDILGTQSLLTVRPISSTALPGTWPDRSATDHALITSHWDPSTFRMLKTIFIVILLNAPQIIDP